MTRRKPLQNGQRVTKWGLILTSLTVLIILMQPGLASAHEKRQVGKFTMVVGFIDEPAYAGVKNALDLTVCDGTACNYMTTNGAQVLSNPVNDADKSLKVEVMMGSNNPLPLVLQARYNNPGKYAAYFMPTKSGDYTYHISGALNGQNIDEKFTSSPKGFSAVEDVKTYPVIESSVNPADLQTQVNSVQSNSNIAIILGAIGIVVGILGLACAAVVLMRRSKQETAILASNS